jgi:hypothetical protein
MRGGGLKDIAVPQPSRKTFHMNLDIDTTTDLVKKLTSEIVIGMGSKCSFLNLHFVSCVFLFIYAYLTFK